MTLARPTPAQERWLLLATRHAALRALAETPGRTGGWKTSTWLSRCLSFVLGLAGAGMLVATLRAAPATLLLSGVVLLAAAEWLIARRRMVRSGIEEALHLAGLLCLAVQWLEWTQARGGTWLGVIALAFLLAGLRLLNPLLTTLAALFASAAVGFGDTLGAARTTQATAASLGCAALALLALAAGGRTLARPSHDRMLDGLVVALPPAAYAWAVFVAPRPLGAGGAGPGLLEWLPVTLVLGLGITAVLTGMRRRRHAPLFAALACLACLAHALRAVTGLAPHWQLIAWGLLVLAAAVTLDRALREPRDGITSRDLGEDGAALELLQVAGAAAAAPRAPDPPARGFEGQGGDFGGGGASGRF